MATKIADEYPDIAKRLAELTAERAAILTRPLPDDEAPVANPGVQVYVNWTPNSEDYG